MNSTQFLPFEPQTSVSPIIPLARYLPSCPPGMIEGWLSKNVPHGSWVLDPFGSTPLVALQAARAGYKVLVAANNPLLAFSLELLSSAKIPLDFQTALADLASTRRGDQRIELQIQSLYLTRCASCGKDIQATGYLWRKGENSPYARVYTCPFCGDEGEHAITEADIARLKPLQRAEPLHRARAIEKVLAAEADNDLKENIREAVQIYPVRPLVVLFTLLNKLESLLLSDEKRKNLQALVISVLDAGTCLWSWPDTKDTPRLMATPPEFFEKNLWMEMEKAVDYWTLPGEPVECTIWPDLPSKEGICIFPGRMKTLQEVNQNVIPRAVICDFPRPNQSFWTLSALWSAWIWGKEHASHYVNVLNRRRYDWLWHSRALHSALSAAVSSVPEKTPFFGLLPEAVPGLILSSCIAASSTHLEPLGFSCKSDAQIVQILWETSRLSVERSSANLQSMARESIRKSLLDLGQPTTALPAYTSAVLNLSQSRALPLSLNQITAEELSELHNTLQKIFLDRSFMVHYESTAQDLEAGSWGLVNCTGSQDPLDDRIEYEVYQILLRHPIITFSDLRTLVYQKLPGIFTPPDELLINTLKSYAEYCQADKSWHIRSGENPEVREVEVQEISSTLKSIGAKLGFLTQGNQPLTWIQPATGKKYQFYISTTTGIHPFANSQPEDSTQNVFVFPGSRAVLLDNKLSHNPQLRSQVSQNWHFLKFRYVRELSQREDLTPDLWNFLLDGDPISPDKDTQLRIFF